MSNQLTKDELLLAQILSDPVFFAEAFLHSPTNPKEDLALRSYQKGIIRDRHQRRVLRMGRRTGKTTTLAVEAIWKAFTFSDREVLVVAGYDSQVNTIFNIINRMVKDSPEVTTSIKGTRMRPYEISFKNGSIIMGYVGNNSVRGKCFPGDTYIVMADGSTKQVKNIEEGDKVLSHLFYENQTVSGTIAKIYDNGVQDIFELQTSTDRLLHATSNHKIMTFARGWTALEDLKTQENEAENSDFVAIIHPDGNQLWARAKRLVRLGTSKTYDFTVEPYHNLVAFTPTGIDKSGFKINGVHAGGFLVHNSADDLFIDEVDSIPNDYLLEAVLPISTTHKNTTLTISGTPSGRREYFYSVSRNKDLPAFDFHEHYVPATASPEWTPQFEEFQRSITTKAQFDREYLAEFGNPAEGVFKNKFIDQNLYVYDYKDLKYNKNNAYILGVDWNEAMNGVQAVVLEYVTCSEFLLPFNDGEYKLPDGSFINPVEKSNFLRVYFADAIDPDDYTNVGSVEFILKLMQKIPFDMCAFDKGHGEANFEILRLALDKGKYVSTNGQVIVANNLRYMLDKIISVDMGSTFEIIDPVTKQPVKALTKNVMVKNTQMLNENANFVIPAINKKGHIMEDDENGLIGQMRNYMIERIGKTGEIYGVVSGLDHRLDAFMLATHAYMTQHSIFHKREAEFGVEEVEGLALKYVEPGWRSNMKLKTIADPTVSIEGGVITRNYGNWVNGEPPEVESDNSKKFLTTSKFKHSRRAIPGKSIKRRF